MASDMGFCDSQDTNYLPRNLSIKLNENARSCELVILLVYDILTLVVFSNF